MSSALSNHEKFLEHLDKSDPTRWLIARWLVDKGHCVRIPPVSKAPTHAQWKQHADNGDLEISLRIEVKQLDVSFTGPEDWPYRDKFIVCAKHSYDRAKPKPYSYVIVSACQKHAAIVMGDTSKLWHSDTRTDSRYASVTQEYYFCPIDQIKWVRL